MEITDAWIALIGTVIASIGLEIVRRWLSKSKDKEDLATTLRQELRDEVQKLREEVRQEAEGHDNYREKYWNLFEEQAKVTAELRMANELLKKNGLPHTDPPGLEEMF